MSRITSRQHCASAPSVPDGAASSITRRPAPRPSATAPAARAPRPPRAPSAPSGSAAGPERRQDGAAAAGPAWDAPAPGAPRAAQAAAGEAVGRAAGGAGAPGAACAAPPSDDDLDCAALADLLPGGGADGAFDVLLPGGERLGVVVSGKPASLSYLISPGSDGLGGRLRRQRMELEQRMERLTRRSVSITVL